MEGVSSGCRYPTGQGREVMADYWWGCGLSATKVFLNGMMCSLSRMAGWVWPARGHEGPHALSLVTAWPRNHQRFGPSSTFHRSLGVSRAHRASLHFSGGMMCREAWCAGRHGSEAGRRDPRQTVWCNEKQCIHTSHTWAGSWEASVSASWGPLAWAVHRSRGTAW